MSWTNENALNLKQKIGKILVMWVLDLAVKMISDHLTFE
jgi:hypothetical protein